MTTHTQCLLDLNGSRQTAWIPSRGAKLGGRVELKDDGELWTVLAVYDTCDSAIVIGRERDFKNHRKATDI